MTEIITCIKQHIIEIIAIIVSFVVPVIGFYAKKYYDKKTKKAEAIKPLMEKLSSPITELIKSLENNTIGDIESYIGKIATTITEYENKDVFVILKTECKSDLKQLQKNINKLYSCLKQLKKETAKIGVKIPYKQPPTIPKIEEYYVINFALSNFVKMDIKLIFPISTHENVKFCDKKQAHQIWQQINELDSMLLFKKSKIKCLKYVKKTKEHIKKNQRI
ncbi:MAG: hypothetical protein DRQ51_03715 [Gammaproteobacteria bacterium]|nr:MAG: hypothetical protein DRQ51_03715 [Gammaproteobacteria bacterium]